MILPTDTTAEVVSALANRLGFSRADEKEFRTESGDRLEIIWAIVPGLSLHYVEDGISDSRFVEVHGDEIDDVADIAESLNEVFQPFSYNDLLNAHRNAKTPEESQSTLLRLALGAPPERDEEFSSLIERALRSPEQGDRRAGLLAATYYGLPEFIPAIQAIARDDAALAGQARDVLRGFEEDQT
jgi:hypothetical protein